MASLWSDLPDEATIQDRIQHLVDQGDWRRDDQGLLWARDYDDSTGEPLLTWHRIYFQPDEADLPPSSRL